MEGKGHTNPKALESALLTLNDTCCLSYGSVIGSLGSLISAHDTTIGELWNVWCTPKVIVLPARVYKWAPHRPGILLRILRNGLGRLGSAPQTMRTTHPERCTARHHARRSTHP